MNIEGSADVSVNELLVTSEEILDKTVRVRAASRAVRLR
jgi:hypothetical protein